MGVGTSGSFLPLDSCTTVRIAGPSDTLSLPNIAPDCSCSLANQACSKADHPLSCREIRLDAAKLTIRLGKLLNDVQLASSFALEADTGRQRTSSLQALLALAEQSVSMGIDYRSLGLGWHHPRSRMEYRSASHPSQTAKASRERAMESQRCLVEAVTGVAKGDLDLESVITKAFVREIGLSPKVYPGSMATFSGVSAALAEELLLPLRALNEGLLAEDAVVHTMNGEVLPSAELRRSVEALTAAVLSKRDGFSEWRYSNEVGANQLRGLSEMQVRQWQQPFAMEHDTDDGGLCTHEDNSGELGLFWATKIGGPSHGFDYEGHCVLPLLANARHKVIFVSDLQWTHFPAGRAHWKLLWTAGDKTPSSRKESEPRLWLEALNRDTAAEQQGIGVELQYVAWLRAVLRHALAKADAMHVVLSVNAKLASVLGHCAESGNRGGRIYNSQERMLLRPSNGVVEASDELGSKHDWLQLTEEVTEPLWRTLYVPSIGARSISDADTDWALQGSCEPPTHTLGGRRSRNPMNMCSFE